MSQLMQAGGDQQTHKRKLCACRGGDEEQKKKKRRIRTELAIDLENLPEKEKTFLEQYGGAIIISGAIILTVVAVSIGSGGSGSVPAGGAGAAVIRGVWTAARRAG